MACLIVTAASACAQKPALQQRCERIFGNRAGTLVVYDLNDGAMKAVVHQHVAFEQAFAPGSLIKIVTALALLQNGVVTPDATFVCTNRLELAGRVFTCGVEGGHGRVNLLQALARSCSIYFYRLAPRLTARSFEDAAHALGLGGPPGRLSWSHSLRLQALTAVGEGSSIMCSPWQITQMMIEVAKGKSAALKAIQRALLMAVTSGTAQPAAVAGLDIAGKTGTADLQVDINEPENLHAPRATHGWFSGYMPAGHPRWVVTVFLGRGTGHDAAALAGKIFKQCAP
jgi:cell division protein FtsI/penicillin-binding protein 2